jgi:two-component sensor histidine kinase
MSRTENGGPASVSDRMDLPSMASGQAADAASGQGRWRLAWFPALTLSALLSLLTLAVLLPFLALAAYSVQTRVQTATAAELNRLSEIAANLAGVLDRELRDHLETAEMLTASRVLQAGDLTAFRQQAEDAASRANGHFILIDQNYQQRVNTDVPAGARLLRANDVDAVTEVFATGAPQIGNLGLGTIAYQLRFAVHLPVIVADEVRYVLSYVPQENAILDLVKNTYRPDGWRAGITDGNGIIVARSRMHEQFFGRPVNPDVRAAMVGKAGQLDSVDLEGNPSVTAFHASALSDWNILVWATQAQLRQPATEARHLLLLLMSLALAGSIAAAYFAGWLFRTPTRRLMRAAGDLAHGRDVRFTPTVMQEANVIGEALTEAADKIRLRENALQEAEEQMRVVMREMSHRTMNLLTVVQAIANQSGRTATDFDSFRERFKERLAGLSRSHDLLVNTGWNRVPLAELVRSQLSAFADPDETRLTLSGPPLMLSPQAAQHLGMALHELSTNALKHGALSVPSGQVHVAWWTGRDKEGDALLTLRWSETGGPKPAVPERRSFGSMVIEDIVPGSVGGTARVDWPESGLVWELTAPASGLI